MTILLFLKKWNICTIYRFIISDLVVLNGSPCYFVTVNATQFARTYDFGSGLQNAISRVFAYSTTNGIVVVAAPGQTATIYSAAGLLVKKSTLSSDQTFIALPQGLYVVSVDDFKIKVLVK